MVSIEPRPGFVCLVCPSEAPHFFEFPYAICVEGYLRGRHPLRISCTLQMGTMKARVEVRRDSAMYDTVHRALINGYVPIQYDRTCYPLPYMVLRIYSIGWKRSH